MTTTINFNVPGTPVGKGRPKVSTRGGRFAQMYTPEKTVNYEGLVALSAAQAMAGRPPITGPAHVTLVITLPIPASWSKKKQAAALQGLVYATKKPDIDNVEKALFDGMNGVVWKDDVQAVDVVKCKRYGPTPGVLVVVEEIQGALFAA
ncbi:RusA family crossover junction endodeoxyribonuclease [Aquitalea aquatica]|uniref:RusA family crossover junction endodeoxyribonuclease n=1 Tax=Aquitalea aquatica TaxID=3044273 RepID=A0A838Y4K1_9NEIS|nr:RusA family crossover junction endodeoxyribonuclease [Aquitalea magnusonii]MBA4707529.1 RusA family crossover junction endodeoxyribonuclease [Aquitalea magnusonii]